MSDVLLKIAEDIGGMKSTLESMDSHLGKINNTLEKHDERIDVLETIESNRKAVKKYMAGVWALIGGVISQLATIAWKIVK